jgi:hypothetical protein
MLIYRMKSGSKGSVADLRDCHPKAWPHARCDEHTTILHHVSYKSSVPPLPVASVIPLLEPVVARTTSDHILATLTLGVVFTFVIIRVSW